ncbi:MAG: hypothetical protein AAGE89_00135 [Pseudomonadota bacterium]
MTPVVTTVAILISVLGLSYLCYANPRRIKRHQSETSASTLLSWISVCCLVLPPLALALVFHNIAAFAIWIGAILVIGWSVTRIMSAI